VQCGDPATPFRATAEIDATMSATPMGRRRRQAGRLRARLAREQVALEVRQFAQVLLDTVRQRRMKALA
jgi:hypothetical protein